jgi:chemosensory pili system protein ChpB (putative protein-glutamate methylesterase)
MRTHSNESRDVSIALLYQARALHEHLKQALTELGASVVYDSSAANFDRSALDRSGARVVVVNLDPEVAEDFTQLDELLEDDAFKVIFNDGEVSSRLEGWDQARWARHLAAKILGVSDTNPPRPRGSEAIPVRVKHLAPEHPSATLGGLSFELEGDALQNALSADTGEAILLTRAALVTKDEPIAAETYDPYARPDAREAEQAPPRDEMPTVELPRVKMEDAVRRAEEAAARDRPEAKPFVPASERPTVRLQAADVEAALGARGAPVTAADVLGDGKDDLGGESISLASVAPDDLALQFDLAVDDASASNADDELSLAADSLSFTALGDGDVDDSLDDGSIDFDLGAGARATSVGAGEDAGDDLDAALRDFGFLDEGATPIRADSYATDDGDGEAALGDSLALADDDFGAALGALDLEPFEGDDAPSPSQRDSAPPPSLDDMLMQMRSHHGEDASTGKIGEKPASPMKSSEKPTVAAPAVKFLPEKSATPAATPAAATPTPAAPATSAAVAAANAAAAAKQRSVSDFDLSYLSLEPIGDGPDASAPTSGRASFGTTAEPAAPEPVAAPRATSPTVPPPIPDDFGGLTLEAMDFDLDETPAVAPVPAAPQPAPPARAATAAPASRAAPPAAPRAAPPPAAAADDDMSLDAFDFSLDGDADPVGVQRDDGSLADAAAESDLMAELAAMSARASTTDAPADGPITRVWVLGASIGGPEAVREFLGAIPADAPVLFLLAQHMGADFLDLMVQQLARATPLTVRTVVSGDQVAHGQVIVVPLAERLLIDRSGEARVTTLEEQSSYSPSIDQVMRDTADRFGADCGAIVFSGMAHDAIDGAIYMHERGGTIWVQDPATCVISSMVDGARDAGVASLVGSPAELARQFMLRIFRAGG